jgi:hypothetical protein
MNSYFEAYEKPTSHVFEKEENPQVYDKLVSDYVNPKAKRHVLGVVGGNDMYQVKGNRVDLESDLFGITRPFTWSTERKHLPTTNSDSIDRKNPKNSIAIDATPIIREEYQMWSYPAVFAPIKFNKESCIPKNKL